MLHRANSEECKLARLDATRRNIVKSISYMMFAILLLVGVSAASGLPDAPNPVGVPNDFMLESTNSAPILQVEKPRTIDATFLSLAVISTASTFADSYTTLFARQNWLAGKTGVCNKEVESAYLYGTHPTVARSYEVAAAKSSISLLASYYLRKRHSKLWSVPLAANSVLSLQGVTQNMIVCN